MAWLFEARKRHGLSILNYIVTSNHVHLLVSGHGDRDVIPKSIQLLAGKTGQEYEKHGCQAYTVDREPQKQISKIVSDLNL